MATTFSATLLSSAKMLEEAADKINEAMTWDTTPEGGSYWSDVVDRLRARAHEARLAHAQRERAAAGGSGAKVAVAPKPSTPTDPIAALREKVNKALQQGEAKA